MASTLMLPLAAATPALAVVIAMYWTGRRAIPRRSARRLFDVSLLLVVGAWGWVAFALSA